MMRSTKYMALIAIAYMSAITTGQTPEIPPKIPGLPVFGSILDTLEREEPAMGAFLRDALKSTDAELLAMLRSDDPDTISLGIWIAHYHGRPDLLLQTPELLDDERRGLSDLSKDPQHGYLIVPRTPRVNSRYQRTIHFWIPGLPYEGQPLRDALEAKPDPWANAETWSRRLHRAIRYEPPEEFDRIKGEFLSQPESVVWFAVLDPHLSDGSKNVFTTAEVKRILSGLSEDLRHKIEDRTAPLPAHYQRVIDSGAEETLESDTVKQRFDRYDALMGSP